MPAPQTYQNHTRFDPMFHFFLIPLAIANVVIAIRRTIQFWPHDQFIHIWWVVLSIVLFMTIGLIRAYGSKNQDRIIRLEERLRYASILPTAALAQTDSLTLRQIIALRFASDAELPSLIQRAVSENLTGKQIKQSIVSWRPDYTRV